MMADLLQSHIRESCKLAMPVGLKELMSDISREVLRSQPENLYQFIADYLEALLNAREVLSIACRVCGDICNCSCVSELDYELSCVGLIPEDVVTAKNIILEHFDKGQVNESNLLLKLAQKFSVTETQLLELKKAVYRAFQRQILKDKNIKVSFAQVRETKDRSETSQSTTSSESSSSDFYKPTSSAGSSTLDSQTNAPFPVYHPCILSESATTLAGSYMHLPPKVPYSVHQSEDNVDLTLKRATPTLNILRSLIFTEESKQRKGIEKDSVSVVHFEENLQRDEEEVDDTISNIVSFFEKQQRKIGSLEMIKEDIDDSSSGDSLSY